MILKSGDVATVVSNGGNFHHCYPVGTKVKILEVFDDRYLCVSLDDALQQILHEEHLRDTSDHLDAWNRAMRIV